MGTELFKRMNYLLVMVCCCLSMAVAAQQEEHCATDRMLQEALKDPVKAARIQQARNEIQYYLHQSASRDNADTTITIPVVVHVLHTGDPLGTGANISDTQIESQIKVLNDCFNDRSTSGVPVQFIDRLADVRVKFCLAVVDDSGNPTTGITRDSFGSINSNAIENGIKNQIHWNPEKYLNIYTTYLSPSLTVLGYTNPIASPSPDANDGIVVDYRAFGSKPANAFNNCYNLGKTAVHEVGHWLGLYHIFEGGCVGMTDSTCDKEGDLICDTPPATGQTSPPSCGSPNLVQNTCHESPADETDMWMNYMDYPTDLYLKMYTNGQKERMRAVLNTSRLSIQYSTAAGNCKDTVGVGLHEMVASAMNITAYPNPTNGTINLRYVLDNEVLTGLKVTDIMGRVIVQKQVAYTGDGTCTIDLHGQPNGLYFISARTQYSEKTLKISLLQ